MVKILAEQTLRVSPTVQIGDASDCAVGAVVYDAEEYEKSESSTLIMFLSKILNKVESNWSTMERKAYRMGA